MKRYLLFAGDNYYPSGGWADFKGSFASIEEIKKNYPLKSEDWWHIIDLEIQDQISSGYKNEK